MNPVYVWLLMLVLFLIIEVATMGLTTIWFAGGALVALLVSMSEVSIYVQMLVFLVVSLVLLYFTRPIAVRFFNTERIKTNVDSIVGKQGIVLSEIYNRKETGLVSLNGMEWSARAYKGDNVIPEGAIVIVKEVRGVRLIVEEKENEV